MRTNIVQQQKDLRVLEAIPQSFRTAVPIVQFAKDNGLKTMRMFWSCVERLRRKYGLRVFTIHHPQQGELIFVDNTKNKVDNVLKLLVDSKPEPSTCCTEAR